MLSVPSIVHAPLPFNPRASFLSSADSVDLISSSTAQRDLKLTTSLHAAITKSGLLHSNVFVANALLDAYAKCGHLDFAQKLFVQMPDRDIVSWTSIISGHYRNGSPSSALSLFVDLLQHEESPAPNEFTVAVALKACALLGDEKTWRALHGYLMTSGFSGDVFICNSLIDMYSKLGLVSSGRKILCQLSCRDVVSWSAVISGCVLHGSYEKALALFIMMLEDGVAPNLVTLLTVIRACSLMSQSQNFGPIHAWVFKLEMGDNTSLSNSLVEIYSKNGLIVEGLKVLIQTCVSTGIDCFDADAIGALLHGCAVSQSLDRGKEIHGLLIKHGFFPSTIIENSLVDMYAKNEHVASAHSIFGRMEKNDIVSWNTMISCFAKNDNAFEALELLTELHGNSQGELAPDSISILSSIQACAEIASLQQGQILHGFSLRSGFNSDVFICNALIDMYAKSGRIDFAEQVFGEMDAKDLSSWNSMIQAYGTHGDGSAALRVFNQLKELGDHTPNAITFASVISACSHSGLAEKGYEFFKSMQREYGIEPSMEHYAAMVDLLGRSGKLDEAEHFIEQMPVEPSSAVWGALLGACGVCGNVEVAERAAEKLAVLEPDGIVWRVALSNVYASCGRWEDVGKLRSVVRSEGSGKGAGWSSVEVNGRGRLKFIVGDTRHPETERIYEVWCSISEHILDAC